MMNEDAGARVVSASVDLAETDLGAYVTFLQPAAGVVVAGFGDGSLRMIPLSEGLRGLTKIADLEATPLAACGDLDSAAALVGTDDGRLLKVAAEGVQEVLAHADGAWVDHVAVSARAKLRAFGAGRAVHVIGADGASGLVLEDHPSTVAGLAFAPDGASIAVAHYGGVTIWPLAGTPRPERLAWHGSHIALAWSPDGRYIVTAMQDKEMHCWRMADRRGMRMSGYPKKIRSLSWTADSQYLAASGADTVTSWGFMGGGPGGKPPLEFGYVFNGTVTAVAASPKRHLVAGGYDDGTVLIGDIEKGDAVIARPAGGATMTALAWSSDGACVVAGTEKGEIALMRVGADALAPVAA